MLSCWLKPCSKPYNQNNCFGKSTGVVRFSVLSRSAVASPSRATCISVTEYIGGKSPNRCLAQHNSILKGNIEPTYNQCSTVYALQEILLNPASLFKACVNNGRNLGRNLGRQKVFTFVRFCCKALAQP